MHGGAPRAGAAERRPQAAPRERQALRATVQEYSWAARPGSAGGTVVAQRRARIASGSLSHLGPTPTARKSTAARDVERGEPAVAATPRIPIRDDDRFLDIGPRRSILPGSRERRPPLRMEWRSSRPPGGNRIIQLQETRNLPGYYVNPETRSEITTLIANLDAPAPA